MLHARRVGTVRPVCPARNLTYNYHHPPKRPTLSHYDVLGIQRNATPEEIKRAYTKLAKKYHPDKNNAKSAADHFHKLQQAYKVLSDVEQRRLYDGTQGILGSEPRNPYQSYNMNYYSAYRPPTQGHTFHQAWQAEAYMRAKTREDYARYQRDEYQNAFIQRKNRIEIFIIVLLVFVTALWLAPATFNTNSRKRTVEHVLDEEVSTSTSPDQDSSSRMNAARRRNERFIIAPATPGEDLTNEEVDAMIKALSVADREKIREIKVQHGDKLTDDIFQSLALFPHIQSLDVSGCSQLTGTNFANLRKQGHFKEIQQFEAVGCPRLTAHDTFLHALASLPDLKHLHIDQPEALLVPLLASATKLQTLQLARVEHRTITDAAFKAIATLTTLKSLKLNSLEGVSSHNFALLSRLSSLQSLALCHAPELGAESMLALGENRNLRSLDLSDCKNVADDVMLCIISQFPSLESLTLAGTDITDNALFLLAASRASKLTRLNLARCPRLSKDVLRHLTNVGTLHDVRLDGTSIRKHEILEHKRRYPNKAMRITVSADQPNVSTENNT